MRHPNEDHELTRDDFPDFESWLRYHHEGGFVDDEDPPHHGSGHYAQLSQATRGTAYRYGRCCHENEITFQIKRADWESMHLAVVFANCRGIKLNSLINISWSTMGVTADKQVGDAHALFLKKMRKWIRNHDIDQAWVWSIENGKTFGLHSHILVHIPDRYRDLFEKYVSKSVARIAKRPVVFDRRKKVRTVRILHAGQGRFISQWRMFRYVSKGVENWVVSGSDGVKRGIHKVLGLRKTSSGKVCIKRSGVSQSLDVSKRDSYFASNGKPPLGIDGATGPRDVFGDRYLKWGEQQRKLPAEGDAKDSEYTIPSFFWNRSGA